MVRGGALVERNSNLGTASATEATKEPVSKGMERELEGTERQILLCGRDALRRCKTLKAEVR